MYFCTSCGEMIAKDHFEDMGLVQEVEKKLRATIQGLEGINHTEVTWNHTVNKYARIVENLRYVLETTDCKTLNNEAFIKRFDMFLERCKTPEFHIAFVGTIKAGKSTLINALLGKNLASTSVTPETAVLTKFRHCTKGNYIKVKFYNQSEWEELWASISTNADVFLEEYRQLDGESAKNEWLGRNEYHQFVTMDQLEEEIERWTSSKHVEHYFVKEVEVGLSDFGMPEEVVFVDTPGLDDAVRYRSDVTRNYIDRANAVFACVKSDALTGPELNTLYRIFANTSYNPEKVYVIGTQWDVLNDPIDNWKLQKAEWVKYLSRNDCYGNKDIAERNITHVAAHIHNLIRDYEILDMKEKMNLMAFGIKFAVMPDKLENELARFRELANVSTVERKIKTDIVQKYADYMYQDIHQSYIDLKRDLQKLLKEVRQNQVELIHISNKDIEEILVQQEKAQQELKEIEEYREQLTTTLTLVREDTERRVENLCEQLRGMVK